MIATVAELSSLRVSSPDEAEERSSPPLTRVLHIVNGEHYAGAERVQDLLGLRLPDCGFEAGFVCLKPGKFNAVRKAVSAPCYLASMLFRFDLSPALSIARLVRQQGYELVHTHTPRSALIGRVAARLAGVPMVHHIHSPTSADSTHRRRDAFNAFIERRSFRKAAALIAVSRSLAEYVRSQGVRAERIHVAPNGVPVQGPLRPRPTPHGQWTLGMVALFRPRKGLEVLLAALGHLRAQGLDLRLRAIGGFETPEYQRQIHDQVQKLGLAAAIDWVGFTRNVPAELGRIDLLALPSLFGEGLPMVALEAMAAGVPVVGTHVEGVPEAVRDGLDGVIVEPNDAAAFAGGLARVIRGQLDYQSLRASAHRRQAEQFSDDGMARRVAEVYRAVLSRTANKDHKSGAGS